MADIEINYKNSTIASTSSSGTITLDTAGTYCEDDIEVTYIKSSGTYVGGTIAWNQQMRKMSSTYYVADGSSTVSISDGVATITPTAQYGGIRANTNNLPTNIDGHKMLAVASVLSENMSIIISLNAITSRINTPSQNWQTLYVLINADSTNTKSFRVRVNDTSNFSTFYVKNCMVFDLTAMFGSTIADYIYTLESNTAGTGVAWLKSCGFFNSDYYPFNKGTLLSINSYGTFAKSNNENIVGNFEMNSTLELHGILKLDANNNLYYDGDEYASDGTVTRNYGIIDLGTLNWSKSTNEFRSSSAISNILKPSAQNVVADWAICSMFQILPSNKSGGVGVHQGYTGVAINTDGRIWARNDDFSNTSEEDFKTAMNGVYLVYKLSTPTTESAKELPYVNPIILKNGVLLPAAELIQTYSYNRLFVTDESGTIPAYTTTATSMLAGQVLSPTIDLDLTNYDYCLLIRGLAIPIYNTDTKEKGRTVFTTFAGGYEIVNTPANMFYDGSKYYNKNAVSANGLASAIKNCYWSSATAVSATSSSYGPYFVLAAPTFSSAAVTNPTLTVKSPAFYIRGSTSVFTSSAWSKMTDIRFQYKIEVYRIAKSTYNLDGWGFEQQTYKIVNDYYNNNATLT